MSDPTATKAEAPKGRKPRPLSPHLQVYKPQLTSVLSIIHRMTGVALCGGVALFALWLAVLAGGPESYNDFVACAQSWPGQIILAGMSFAFFYHLSTGIRHLFWDAGMFLDIADVYKTGRLAIAAAVILTAVTWLKVYGVGL